MKEVKRWSAGLVSAWAFWLVLVAGVALGQTTVGEVKGIVKDPSGAVIPDTSLVLQSTATNNSRQTQTDSDGLFSFPNMPPGSYQLTAERQGFKKWSGKLDLQIQQVAVLDLVLEVGEMSSTIEVEEATPTIAAESSSIGTVTDFKRIQQLPLDGRDVLTLFQLTPGVQGNDVPRGDGTFPQKTPGNAPDAPRVNGLKAGGAGFLQDGTAIGDAYSGSISRIRPGLDTIQEFRIDTNSTAQYQRPNTVSILTRSGTNALHGSIFETFRNNGAGLRARARNDGDTPARLLRNEFGATAGGPVVIPRLYNGKDKTFWFFSYEGQRRRQGLTYDYVVPTGAMWNGDFSNIVDAQGNKYTIYDPATTDAKGVRQPFPNNIIPADRHRSAMFLYLKDHTPGPTNTVSPMLGNNWIGPVPEYYNQNTYTTKVDHRFSDRNLVSGRFSIANADSVGYFGAPQAPDLSYNTQRTLNKIYSGSMTCTHIFSPNKLNELVMAGQRSNSQRGGGRDDVDWDQALGVANPLGISGWPTLTARTRPAYFLWDSENRTPQYLNNITVDDNLTLIRNKHDFKFGFRVRDERNNTWGEQQGQGRYGFGEGYTALYDPISKAGVNYTGFGLASMLLGYGEYFAVQYNRPFYYLRQREYGFYAQDSWKVTPRLTLNYGLRYDYWTPYREARGRFLNLDTANLETTHTVLTPAGYPMESLGLPSSLLESYTKGGLAWSTADKAGFPDNLLLGDKKDFGPRLGAAFKVNNKTVLRGGYGVYYWTTPLAQLLGESGYNVPLNLRYVNDIANFNGATDGYFDFRSPYVPGVSVDDPNPVDLNNPQTTSPPFGFVPWDKQWRNNRAQEWNFTIEREIMPLTSLRLSYVGNHGSNLDQTVVLNSPGSRYLYATSTGQAPPDDYRQLAPNSFWQYLPMRTHAGYSNSNSFQVNVERQYNRGLAFQWFYVFSRSLSTTDGDGYSSQPGQVVPSPGIVPGGGSLDQLLRLVYFNVGPVPKHQMRWNVVYDLPFWKKSSGGWAKVLGGWQVASIGSFRTGSWLNPQAGIYPYDAVWAYQAAYWLNGDPRLSADQRKVINFGGQNQLLYFKGNFDTTGIPGMENYQPALVKLSPDGTSNDVPVRLKDGSITSVPYDVYNSMPRNFIEGPKSWLTDFSIVKNFRLKESMNIRFAADFFNLFNHPNNLNPDPEKGLVDLGQQWNDPRTIQFSLRFDF